MVLTYQYPINCLFNNAYFTFPLPQFQRSDLPLRELALESGILFSRSIFSGSKKTCPSFTKNSACFNCSCQCSVNLPYRASEGVSLGTAVIFPAQLMVLVSCQSILLEYLR